MNKTLKTFMLWMFCFAIATSIYPVEQQGIIKVTVRGFKSSTGTIKIGLYKSAQTFPKVEKQYKGKTVDAVGDEVRVAFTEIPLGEYAVAVFHDENSNGKLDENTIGIPQEAYGCSNGTRGVFGPPSFDDAKVTLRENSSQELIINIK